MPVEQVAEASPKDQPPKSETAYIAAWQAAGLTDVGVSLMSLGGGLVMWGRKAPSPPGPSQ